MNQIEKLFEVALDGANTMFQFQFRTEFHDKTYEVIVTVREVKDAVDKS